MFTVVLPAVRPAGGAAGLFPFGGMRAEEHRTMGVRWRLIRLGRGRRINWKRVARLAGRHSRCLVLPQGMVLPPNAPVAAVCLQELQKLLAAKCICRVIPKGSTVAVLDPDGSCLSAGGELLRQAGCIKVFTHRPHRWEACARRLLQEQGAPVVLCRSPDLLSDCGAVLLGGPCAEWMEALPPGIFAAAAFAPPRGCSAAWRFRVSLPPGVEGDLPPGVDSTLLAEALYQLGGRRSLQKLQPDACLWQEKHCTMTQLENSVKSRDPLPWGKA